MALFDRHLPAVPQPPPPQLASRGLPGNPAQGIKRLPPGLPPVLRPAGVGSSTSSWSVKGPSATDIPASPKQIVAIVRDAVSRAKETEALRTAAAAAHGPDQAAEPEAPRGGITVDLVGKNISALPDEVVDLVRDDVERLALSHNSLATLPIRFSECSALRYLAARSNAFEDFPLPLCDLTSLEILDLGRCKLRNLPSEIGRLTSLRALAVQENQIELLPTVLADMPALLRLRLGGNPICFPPQHVLRVPKDQPSQEMMVQGLSETEVNELLVTDQIKAFIAEHRKQQQEKSPSRKPSSNDAAVAADTSSVPTPAARRPIGSGRADFQNVDGTGDLPPPEVLSRPGNPEQSRAPQQEQQQQQEQEQQPYGSGTSIWRPLHKPPPRRSHSASQPEEKGPNSSTARARTALSGATPIPTRLRLTGSAPETTAAGSNRTSSHLRGFSYSEAAGASDPQQQTRVLSSSSVRSSFRRLSSNGIGGDMASPVDSPPLRPQYMRALSAVPVRRRPDSSASSQSFSISWLLLAHEAHQDFDAEAARGILYAVYQVHLGVQTLIGLTRGERNDGVIQEDSSGGGNTGGPWHRQRRSRLEMIFQNANVCFEELEQAIQAYDDDGCHDHDRLSSAKKDPTSTLASAAGNSARTPRPSGMDRRQHPHAHGERIRKAYATLIGAYTHICAELVGSVDLLLDNGDPRYVRTFMMMLFHSVMELRATMAAWLQPRISTAAAAATAASELGSSSNKTSNSNSNSVAVRNGQQNLTPTTIAGSGNGGGSGMKRSTTRQSPPPPLFKTRVGSTGSSDGSSNYVVTRAVGGPSLPLGLSIASSLRPKSSYLSVAAETPRSAESFTSAISSSSSSDGGGGCGPRCGGESGRRALVSHRLLPAVHHVSGLISSIVPGLSEAFAVGARCAAVAGSGGGGSNGSGGSGGGSGNRSINLQQQNRAAAASAIKWQRLAACATALLQQTELLSAHLASDSNNVDALLVPSSPFWGQCSGLAGAWAELGDAIKTVLQQMRLQQRGGRVEGGGSAYVNAAAAAEMQLDLPLDALDGLRRISRAMKELVAAMVAARGGMMGFFRQGSARSRPRG